MSYMQSPKPNEMFIHYTKASIPSLQAQEILTKHAPVPVVDDLTAGVHRPSYEMAENYWTAEYSTSRSCPCDGLITHQQV